MSSPVLEGITARTVSTSELTTRVLFSGPEDGVPVLFIHGNFSSATWWEETMLQLPPRYRGIAPDQRGFGEADPTVKIDATRGMQDLVDDALVLMDKLGYESALRWFVAHQVDCYVIHLLSQEELDPDVKGDLKLVDCEDRDEAEITVSAPLLSRYQRTLKAFTHGAHEYCMRRGIQYLLANNRVPVQQLVSHHLRRRGLVR